MAGLRVTYRHNSLGRIGMRGRKYIVDASVAVKWFIPEDYSEIALRILEGFKDLRITLYAPDSMKLEFINAIRKYYIRGIITGDLMNSILEEMRKIPINYVEIDWELVVEALKIAVKNNITVYDAYYIATSQKHNIQVVTADEKFYNTIAKKYNVILLKNFKI